MLLSLTPFPVLLPLTPLTVLLPLTPLHPCSSPLPPQVRLAEEHPCVNMDGGEGSAGTVARDTGNVKTPPDAVLPHPRPLPHLPLPLSLPLPLPTRCLRLCLCRCL